MILQWHIAFAISFFVISLVLVAIGLWPKIKTCCPIKISYSYKPKNQNSNEQNLDRDPILDQNYLRNHDRIYE